MKVALAANLWESLPPPGYGGTERMLSYLVEELVRQGVDVTLFASGDSHTKAIFRPMSRQALRRMPELSWAERVALHEVMYREAFARAEDYDVIHAHQDEGLHFPYALRHLDRALTTMHYRLDRPDLVDHFRIHSRMRMVSLCNEQRLPMPWMNWVATIPYGLPQTLYRAQRNPQGDYLAFIGRISPQKRPERAIRLARATGMKLKIAARLDPAEFADKELLDNVVQPLFDDPMVEYVGEIGDADKQEFLGNAAALLFPIDWPEAFGIVMIEAMACGTPVIAWRKGSVPEVVNDGVTGRIVEDFESATAALRGIGRFDRLRIRAEFERHFTVRRMAADYIDLYSRIASRTI